MLNFNEFVSTFRDYFSENEKIMDICGIVFAKFCEKNKLPKRIETDRNG